MAKTSDKPNTDVVGTSIEQLDTPALLLDRRACDRNLAKMAGFFRDRPCKLRPHFKNHKCVTLARRQLEAGSAVGMTCAKVGEAEVLVEHGIDDVLIANQVLGDGKLRRLAELNRRATVRVAVDHVTQAQALSQAATAAGVTIGALVEVDAGMGRCGVRPGQPAVELAKAVAGLPGVELGGLQAYEGHAVYVNDFDERSTLTRQFAKTTVDTRRLIEATGLKVRAVSGGASGTYNITGVFDGFDELQCGTYATMDWRYAQVVPEFEIALSVLVTVISRPAPDTAVIDLGAKGAGGEFGPPCIKDFPRVEVPFFGAEEHTVIKNAPDWQVGQTVELISSHACTTCNLYRQMHVHEAGRVVEVWPIEASGKLA